ILFRTLDALRMYDLPVILVSPNSASHTATVSMLVVNEMRTGDFNSASAISTLVFLMLFAVAFVLVKFLGANVVEDRTGKKEEIRGAIERPIRPRRRRRPRPPRWPAPARDSRTTTR